MDAEGGTMGIGLGRVVIGLLIVVLGAAGASGAWSQASGAAVGGKLPGFSAPLLGGGEVSEESIAGGPALLVFWSTGCPYCNRFMPGVERVWRRYGDRGLQVVGITFDDHGDVREARDDLDLSFPLADQGDVAAGALGVRQVPTWFFVDADGVVRFRGTSSDPDDAVLELLAADLLGIDAEDCDTALC
jgi:peroxiredoxin